MNQFSTSENVGIPHVNDAYGQAYADGFTSNCATFGIAVTAEGFSYANKDSIDMALQGMADANINVMMVIVFDEDFGYFMAKAYELGLLGAQEESRGQVQAPARRGLGEVRVEELLQIFDVEALHERSYGVDDRGRRGPVEDRVRPEHVRYSL
mgnify:CR=1 FL=1